MSSSESGKNKKRLIVAVTCGALAITAGTGVFLSRHRAHHPASQKSEATAPSPTSLNPLVQSEQGAGQAGDLATAPLSESPAGSQETAPSAGISDNSIPDNAVIANGAPRSETAPAPSGAETGKAAIAPLDKEQSQLTAPLLVPVPPIVGAGGVAVPSGNLTGNLAGNSGGASAPGRGLSAVEPGKTAALQSKSEPAQPEGCFTLSYHHKKTPGHSTEESCINHKNVIKLKYSDPSSVCVRVNKVPVAFEGIRNKQGKLEALLVGAIAGPQAEITVRYCMGKKTCLEDCTVPKDDFMSSIGGMAQNDKAEGAVQWDPSEKADGKARPNVNAHLSAELKKELDNLDEQEESAPTVFQDWIAGSEAPSCGTKQAMR